MVVIEKLADRLPAATVTEAGTVAVGEEELRTILEPPTGALLDRETDPVAVAPPKTVSGETVKVLIFGARTVSVAVTVTAPLVAVIVTVWSAVTGVVVTVNDWLTVPLTIRADAGTITEALLEERETTTPAKGAGAEIFTKPVVDSPPLTELAESVTALKV